jgi:hypothetical protein
MPLGVGRGNILLSGYRHGRVKAEKQCYGNTVEAIFGSYAKSKLKRKSVVLGEPTFGRKFRELPGTRKMGAWAGLLEQNATAEKKSLNGANSADFQPLAVMVPIILKKWAGRAPKHAKNEPGNS